MAAVFALCGRVAVAVQLPVPCAPGACGTTGPTTFVTSGQATAVATPSTLNINQTSNQAVLNWASFNIDAGGHVVFNQPTTSAIALNRIFQNSPSAIFGSLSANGQVYLINQNGIVFGSTSQVNVGGLLASTLGLSDSVFTAGALAPILLQTHTPALQSDGRTGQVDAAGAPILGPDGKQLPVSLIVESGAQISTNGGAGERILLASQQVQNGGSVSAPDGQIVLAAGQSVYLQASTDPALRGLIVEVDQGGTAWNQLTGALSAPRGNISLVGLAVNQEGRISSTTTVAANGSVSLVAADTTQFTADPTTGAVSITPTHGGTLTLGAQSSVNVTPELSDSATAVADQAQTQSSVVLTGDQILLNGGSQIVAPGGSVAITAEANPYNPAFPATGADARIHVDSGAVIDVSGSIAQLPMAANLVTVQLRANELANDPTQRNGPLRGQTVIVDTRVGTPIADVSGAIAAIGQNIAQRTSAGGHVSLISEGDVVVAQGATINVSGGGTQFAAGSAQTSMLITASGQLVPIGSANPLEAYAGVYNPTTSQVYDRWGVTEALTTSGSSNYQSAYFQGANAGSIQVAGRAIVLQGSLLGHTTSGPYQRTSATAALGGELTIGIGAGLLPGEAPDFLAPSVEFTSMPTQIIVADDATLPAQTLQLPVDYLQTGGFTHTQIFSNGDFTLPANLPLNLSPGGSLAVRATNITLSSSITAPGGALSFTSLETAAGADSAGPRAGIDVGNGVSLDVRGTWTNDELATRSATDASIAPATPTFYNGGSINLALAAAGSQLVLGSDVSLRASGGAWLPATGAVVPGKGGSITLSASGALTAFDIGSNVQLDGFGVVGAAGGTLSIQAPTIAVAAGNSAWAPPQQVDTENPTTGPLILNTALFNQFGFSSFNIDASASESATHNAVSLFTVQAGADLRAETSSLMLLNLTNPSASNVGGFTAPVVLPDATRPGASLTLSAIPLAYNSLTNNAGSTPGDLLMQQGSTIQVDAGAAITLKAAGSLVIDGKLIAPSGTVTAEIVTPDALPDDLGYLPNQRIDLGPTALIDVSGTTLLQPVTFGPQLGTVLPGGSVNLIAERGSVQIESGSAIDASGTTARLEVPVSQAAMAYQSQTISSAGGSVTLYAPDTISLEGTLRLAAGSGGMLAAPGGTLTVDLSLDRFSIVNTDLSSTFPTTPQVIELTDASTTGTSIAAAGATLNAGQLMASGADAVTLIAGDKIVFAGGTTASFARSLTLESPVLALDGSGSASLSAPYLAVSNDVVGSLPMPSTGTGVLSLSGDFIDLIGSTVLQNVGSAIFNSAGDIRLLGNTATAAEQGSFAMSGSLTLDAARIYPATQTTFAISVAGAAANVVQIGQTNLSPGAPLSVNGSLTISADTISSAGTLLAPFGQITLTANSALNLLANSTTSVSGSETTFLYGNVANGTQWLYTLAGSPTTVSGVPSRTLTLDAPAVSIAKGATVDLRGGGDLYAYDWVPGTGGTVDALSNSVSPGLYAVVPSLIGQVAPFDPQESQGFGLPANASIYLSGIAGLPAGTYPLLPARYALLPGAFLVTAASGYQNLAPGQTGALADGTPVIAGRLVYANTGLGGSQYGGFAIYPGSYGHELAEYDNNLASAFFPAQAAAAGLAAPASVADGGRLLISVGTSLDAAGAVLTAAAPGGRGADVEISATRLDVLGPQGIATDGEASISAAVLQSWQPGELLLGGVRSADGESVSVLADAVTIGGNVHLTADDITIVAGQTIEVQSGAVLASTSGTNGQALTTLPADAPLALTGPAAAGAAFLAVSDQSLGIVSRPASTASTAAAVISLESGASLQSRGAVVLDGIGDVHLDGSLQGPGAAVSLAASQITFDPSVTGLGGLEVASALLAELDQASTIRLATPGAINLLTDVSLGASSVASKPTFAGLTLDASSIVGNGTVSALFAAQQISLQGNGAAPTPTPAAGGATLVFAASEIDLGPGNLALTGFATTTLQVGGAVVGRGQGEIDASGNVSINAAGITVAGGAATTVTVPQGALTIGPAAAMLSPAALSLGGQLTLSAQNLIDQGAIIAPAAVVSLQGSQQLELGQGAVVDVSGVAAQAAGRIVGAPGGAISLESGGDLNVASGVTLAANGVDGASAGSLQINAAGAVMLDATLSAAATGSGQGGAFSLVAGTLTNGLSDLSQRLESGGFTSQQSVRIDSGDLMLAAGSQITANQIALAADSGSVLIAGILSAPGAAQRGSISIDGANGVVLSSTGQLHADAGNNGTRGGEINIGTTNGSIDLASGSVISSIGSAQAGDLRLRAPALGNDVAITAIAGDVSGLGSIIVEPMLGSGGQAYFSVGPTVGDSDFASIQGSVATFVSTASGLIARLTPAGNVPLLLEPAVELRQSGDLTLATNLDLSTWAGPIALTVRSGGSLTLDGSLSDGFGATTQGAQHTVLGTGPSSSISLVAGADFSAANPTAIASGAAADLTISGGSMVRTGTGDLSLVAAQDVVIGGPLATSPASVYTGGTPGVPNLVLNISLFSFPTNGGNLLVRAGRDVVGAPVTQSVSDWQIREGGTSFSSAWGVDIDQFQWGLGTLGGGDLTVVAGRDVSNLSAAVADSLGLIKNTTLQTFLPSGSLRVSAGRDIGSGQFFEADGLGILNAGNSFSAIRPGLAGAPIGTLLELGGGQLQLNALNDIVIEGVLNPTLLVQPNAPIRLDSQYFTYGDSSALQLQSIAGNIIIHGNSDEIGQFIGTTTQSLSSFGPLNFYPGTLTARALAGDLDLNAVNPITLFPSANGQLDLFAGHDIVGASEIIMSDAAVSLLPTAANPGVAGGVFSLSNGPSYGGNRHIADSVPAVLTAGNDIDGVTLFLPKQVDIVAGRDIVDLTLQGQNLNSGDLTLVSAGRDIVNDSTQAAVNAGVSLGGPGSLDVIAGRNINLGFSAGLVTIGALDNPQLPTTTGASLTVLTGAASNADFSGFLSAIIAPSATYQQQLIAYTESVTGHPQSSFASAQTAFDAFSVDLQRPLIDDIFFNALLLSGRAANTTPSVGFSAGYAAIDALYPGSRTDSSLFSGSLTMAFSRIYTLEGGDISLLVPGGGIDVGLANPPTNVGVTRLPSQLGIVTQNGGDISIYSQGDVLVNESRIFTLNGGNILVWSNLGSIDAGRGSKSSISAPPPIILVDNTGKVTLDFSAAVAGSGIRTIQTDPAVAPGDVDLDAPVGTVNAGDAGIGAAGNINIAAQHVLGLDNIQFGGSSAGVPAQVSSLGAALTGATSAASGATTAATSAVGAGAESKETAPLAQASLNWLDVFVTGLGEDACRPDDAECLKRQKHN